ncbi:hypothetical protein [Paraburkholderia acidiphila]|uniref:Uncharacterized protein n=1 Tax=Paraburkholderia acidiphila TaxID=2571747 RepID=A0A7Z2G4W1_9BURK|nr:hypothetical protein [Paraburkholderia acidiphila]QGZ54844.1 hypothetical protein FAZ97_07875 [Paraburkholderia acidiphila]
MRPDLARCGAAGHGSVRWQTCQNPHMSLRGGTGMENRRSYEYMGFDMTAGVDGDHEAGFFVSTQIIHSLTDAENANVPIDGIAAGRFPTQDNAFDAAFDRIRAAIDQRVRAAT